MTIYDTTEENIKEHIKLLNGFIEGWIIVLKNDLNRMSERDLIAICKKIKRIDKQRSILMRFIETKCD